jgi:hypothetical protein
MCFTTRPPERSPVKSLLTALATVLLVAWAVTIVPGADWAIGDGDDGLRASGWRRTPLGWEKASEWDVVAPSISHPGARLHPGLLAAFVLLVSLAALVLKSDCRPHPRPISKPPQFALRRSRFKQPADNALWSSPSGVRVAHRQRRAEVPR